MRAGPADRPLRGLTVRDIAQHWAAALREADGEAGAHCIHEWWMRGAAAADVERWLQALWTAAAPSIPEWLPMRHIDWLPLAYQAAGRLRAPGGRSHIYLVLLDYRDRPAGSDYGVYVGMSRYPPLVRFEQHKSGIRAAGSVLKRGLEVLSGPVWHLQHIARSHAERIESELAEALREHGLLVQGGH